ncbi:hypothetical protein D3C81_2029520 [compost metagenome]
MEKYALMSINSIMIWLVRSCVSTAQAISGTAISAKSWRRRRMEATISRMPLRRRLATRLNNTASAPSCTSGTAMAITDSR